MSNNKEQKSINPKPNEITKTILQPIVNKNFESYIWESVINPARAMEARAWVSKNHEKAQRMKGSKGESILHWAVQSEYGFVLECLSAGISPNVKDSLGLTPIDWLINRLWYTVIEKENSPITKIIGSALELEGILRIKAQTEELGMLLIMRGGKATDSQYSFHDGEAWVRSNLWNLIQIKKDREGLESLLNWGSMKKSILHTWILSFENFEKHKVIEDWKKWGIEIDTVDINGRSALWYAVDAWLTDDSWNDVLQPAIKTLLEHSADPGLEDNFGESPLTLLVKDFKKAEIFEEMIK